MSKKVLVRCGLVEGFFVAGVLAALCFIVPFLMAPSVSFAETLNVLKIGTDREITSLDTALIDGTDANIIATALYEGLTVLNPKTLEPEPGLAEKWTSKGNTFTFQLRKGLKWSDGAALSADQVVANFERVLSVETGAFQAQLLDVIVGAESFRKEGNKTKRDFSKVGIRSQKGSLVFELKEHSQHFLSVLSLPAFAPVKLGAQFQTKGFVTGEVPSAGAFRLKKWSLNSALEVEKNPNYYAKDKVTLDGIKFMPIEDPQTAYTWFQSGQIQWTRRLPAQLIASSNPPPELKKAPLLNTVFLRLNVTSPVLKDQRVRQSLSLAIDRSALVQKVLREGQLPAKALVPGESSLELVKTDVAGAQKLLAEAGFPEGKGFPTLEGLFISDSQSKTVMMAIAAMLKRNLGVNFSPKNLERGVFYKHMDALDFQVSRSSFTGKFPGPFSFLEKFTSDNVYNNLTGFKNADFDQALTLAASSKDAGTAADLYSKAERILVQQETAIIPLYHNVATHLLSSQVAGVYLNPMGHHPLRFVSLSGPLAKK